MQTVAIRGQGAAIVWAQWLKSQEEYNKIKGGVHWLGETNRKKIVSYEFKSLVHTENYKADPPTVILLFDAKLYIFKCQCFVFL